MDVFDMCVGVDSFTDGATKGEISLWLLPFYRLKQLKPHIVQILESCCWRLCREKIIERYLEFPIRE